MCLTLTSPHLSLLPLRFRFSRVVESWTTLEAQGFVRMNDLYLARLTAEPPGAMPEATVTDPNPPIHIHPHPNPSDPSQPIPIHFPNIYVHPYPPVPPQPPNNPSVHHPEAAPSNRVKQEGTSHISSREPKINLGPWEMTRPHPLLWICFFLSLLAVVLEFPKGSFPTFTGRHKALRVSFPAKRSATEADLIAPREARIGASRFAQSALDFPAASPSPTGRPGQPFLDSLARRRWGQLSAQPEILEWLWSFVGRGRKVVEY